MSAAAKLNGVTRRIASATSVLRTRSQDEVRLEVHGGRSGDLDGRHAAAVARLERVAERLEKAIT